MAASVIALSVAAVVLLLTVYMADRERRDRLVDEQARARQLRRELDRHA